jgi:N4-gp56 family major capsid protein
MADAYVQVSDLGSAGTAAYEQLSYYALRPELYFDACASVKPTRQSHRGASVMFTIYNEMAPKITTLAETTDVEVVTISDADVTVSLNEYGNASITTARVRAQSFLIVSADVANLIGFNAGISFDSLARNTLVAGTNVVYSGTGNAARADVAAGDHITASDVRNVVANLENNNVQRLGNYYRAFISPLVAVDLRTETGADAWRDPHTYAQPEQIWNGETGVFEGVAFMHTPRLSAGNLAVAQGGLGTNLFVDQGTASEDVHPTLILGNQALAKTFSSMVSAPMPQIILGTVTDRLQRFVPIGWYWNGGFGRFREAALYRIESASSLTA